MQGKKYNITNSIEQTLKLYHTLYAVIGMRLHSGILAITHGIPLIMISYGPKTDEFVNLVDVKGYSLPPHEFTFEIFQKLWQELENHYGFLKANLVPYLAHYFCTLCAELLGFFGYNSLDVWNFRSKECKHCFWIWVILE